MIDRACISLGERCNLTCNYCHFKERLTKNIQEFSLTNLIKIIDNITLYCNKHNLQQFKIGIVGAGEPLLEYHKIKKLIEYISQLEYTYCSFYTITNGTLINEEILNFFYTHKNIINLCFSLDGYEEIHNVGRARFKEVYQNILKYEKIFSTKPSINCTVHKLTIKHAHILRKFFSDENFHDITFSKIVDAHDTSLMISNSEYASFIKDCIGFPFSVRQLKQENSEKYDCTMYGKLCGVGKTNIFITKNGIYPCGRFYNNEQYNYGSFDTSLDNIMLKMQEMQEIPKGECYYNKYIRN